MKTYIAFCTAVLVAGTNFASDKDSSKVTTPAAASASETKVKDVSPEEAEKLLKSNKDVTVLDVRTPEEFESGHIAGAKNVDLQGEGFTENLAALDKEKGYVLHCASGGRSSRALSRMREMGFKNIYHMDGGFSALKEAGKPVEK